MDKNELVKKLCRCALDKKAEKVYVLDIAEMTVVSDYFIICSGSSKTQVKAICDYIEEEMDKNGVKVIKEDGYNEARWIVLDYGDAIVHIFYEEDREFYNLERLWSNGNNMYEYTDN